MRRGSARIAVLLSCAGRVAGRGAFGHRAVFEEEPRKNGGSTAEGFPLPRPFRSWEREAVWGMRREMVPPRVPQNVPARGGGALRLSSAVLALFLKPNPRDPAAETDLRATSANKCAANSLLFLLGWE